MKTVSNRILVIIFIFIFSKNYGQNNMNEFCYNSIDKDKIRTTIKIEILSDSIFIIKSHISSSPNYGEIKKIKNESTGKIIKRNGKTYLKQINDDNPNSANEIILKKKKLIILGYKKKRKFLSNKYDYFLEKGLILKKNKCTND